MIDSVIDAVKSKSSTSTMGDAEDKDDSRESTDSRVLVHVNRTNKRGAAGPTGSICYIHPF